MAKKELSKGRKLFNTIAGLVIPGLLLWFIFSNLVTVEFHVDS